MAMEKLNLNRPETPGINVQEYVAEKQEKIDKEFYSLKFWSRINQIAGAVGLGLNSIVLGTVGAEIFGRKVLENVPEPVWESLKEMASSGDTQIMAGILVFTSGLLTLGRFGVDEAFKKKAKAMAELYFPSQTDQ